MGAGSVDVFTPIGRYFQLKPELVDGNNNYYYRSLMLFLVICTKLKKISKTKVSKK